MRVGVHGRNGEWRDVDFDAVRQSRVQACKIMSFTKSDDASRLSAMGLWLVCRLYDDRVATHVHPAPTAFATRMIPEIQRLQPWCQVFEIHNEPNHVTGMEGWGPTREDAAEFTSWLLMVLRILRVHAPWAKFCFPGLAPNWPHEDYVWLQVCLPAIERCDYLGLHCYWQYEHRTSAAWGQRYRLYQATVPRKALLVTELGDSSDPPLGDEDYGREIAVWIREAKASAIVEGCFPFILSSPDAQWDRFAWVGEDGRIRPVVGAVAQVV